MSSPLVFTSEQISADAQNAIVRTTGQVGAAAAVVNIGEWTAQQSGWHGHLPMTVRDSMVVLLTVAAAWLSNRKKLKGIG